MGQGRLNADAVALPGRRCYGPAMAWLNRLFLLLMLALAAPALAVPALWQASRNGRSITLYGTIHALPPGDGWFSPRARAAFAAADTLVVEIADPDEAGALAADPAFSGLLPRPVPIRERLPAALRPQFDRMVAQGRVPATALDPLKSWLAALTLLQLDMARAGIDPNAGVDVTLIARARDAGKAIVGLETARAQLDLLDRLPEAEQRLLLASSIEDSGQSDKELQALVQTWLAGDAERILKEFDDSSLSPELHKRLLADRNHAWADWVEAALATPGQRFLAVGAAHLAGPGGLVALLQARGFTVEKLE